MGLYDREWAVLESFILTFIQSGRMIKCVFLTGFCDSHIKLKHYLTNQVQALVHEAKIGFSNTILQPHQSASYTVCSVSVATEVVLTTGN